MTYALIQEVPGTAAMYEQVKAILGDEVPDGFLARIVTAIPGGVRHVHVWESQDAWERYQTERVAPAVATVLSRLGIEPDPDRVHSEPVQLIDVAAAPALTRSRL